MITAVAQTQRAEHALRHFPGAAQRALARALNRAVETGHAESLKRITARYAVPAEDVRQKLQVSTASPNNLQVKVSVRSGSLTLARFPHSPSKPGTGGRGKAPLVAEILRGKPKVVKGGFVGTARSSGLQVFKRAGGKTSSGKDKLQALRTVPIAVMLGVEDVRKHVEEASVARLDSELERAIAREIDK